MLEIILIVLATFVTLVCCALMFAIIGVYLYCFYLIVKVACELIISFCGSLSDESDNNKISTTSDNKKDSNENKE